MTAVFDGERVCLKNLLTIFWVGMNIYLECSQISSLECSECTIFLNAISRSWKQAASDD